MDPPQGTFAERSPLLRATGDSRARYDKSQASALHVVLRLAGRLAVEFSATERGNTRCFMRGNRTRITAEAAG